MFAGSPSTERAGFGRENETDSRPATARPLQPRGAPFTLSGYPWCRLPMKPCPRPAYGPPGASGRHAPVGTPAHGPRVLTRVLSRAGASRPPTGECAGRRVEPSPRVSYPILGRTVPGPTGGSHERPDQGGYRSWPPLPRRARASAPPRSSAWPPEGFTTS